MSLQKAVQTKAKQTKRTNVAKQKAMKAVQEETIRRLNVNLPSSLHRKFKVKAASNDVEMTELMVQWVKEYVST